MIDQFFTPKTLAQEVLRLASIKKVKVIADFACGNGDLLFQGLQRWPKSTVIACDIDRKCLKRIARNYPEWVRVQCDFLDDKRRSSSKRFSELTGSCDLVLLNPPFSGRGGSTFVACCSRRVFQCSLAMSFVLNSVQYLRRGGELIAILPASCMSNVKDHEARLFLRRQYDFSECRYFPRGSFPDCTAKTIIVKIRKRKPQSVRQSQTGKAICTPARKIHASLIRGSIPVYRAENGLSGTKYPFLHTTNIRGSEIVYSDRFVDIERRLVIGPSVLIQRVGSPLGKKCCLYVDESLVAISDCLIAIVCGNEQDALEIQRRLLQNWSCFSKLYCGTCAPYITMESLKLYLRSMLVVVK